ncbi:MFS transporter [Radicibacter daui]|uniref:MFS transporter n=1 Tax=Radicibacter daui TaxID=3064829 RepID=UPI004046A076
MTAPLASAGTAPAFPISNPAPAPRWIERGSAEYRQAGIALFLVGYANFSLIYCVQPMLPAFARSFGVTPAESSLALSLTTGFLAFSILLSGPLSQAFGRRGLMFFAMALGALLNIAAGLTPWWHGLLLARAAEGLLLGAVPSTAITYLSEEIDPKHLGRTVGLYVAGTAFGAMMGRVGMGFLTEFANWQTALIVIGVLGLAAAAGYIVLLPPQRNFSAERGFRPGWHLAVWRGHLFNSRLIRLYAIGFLLTSIFVTLFNYATFRLAGAPYSLGDGTISLIFLTYGFGIVSSSVAGSLVGRHGRRRMLLTSFLVMLTGILATLASPIAVIILGVALVTTGLFIGHTTVGGSVGPLAGTTKGHAASLYLFFYYMGSSITGSAGGWFWQHGGWTAITALTGALALAGLVLAAGEPRRS